MANYAASKDATYLELLKIAKLSDNSTYSSLQLNNIVIALNCLKEYQSVHKRIIPLLRLKAKKLKVFNLLDIDVQQLLNKETQKGVITELGQKSQLTSIVKALSAENIPVILLKGSAFANSLYSTSAPRTSNDIDILVKREHWDVSVSVLSELMIYAEKSTHEVFDDLYELSFIPRNKLGGATDLHSSLVHPFLFNIDENELWESSIKHNAYNSEFVRILSPEHALIHQSIHAFKDMDFSKYNLLDTFEIITQLSPDLSKTIETAMRWGTKAPLYVLLMTCSEVMGVDVNVSLLKRIKPTDCRIYVITRLLESTLPNLTGKRKPLKYRMNQVLAQFVFTANIQGPLALQLLFIQKAIGRTIVKIN
jgi:hypothetical protein